MARKAIRINTDTFMLFDAATDEKKSVAFRIYLLNGFLKGCSM